MFCNRQTWKWMKHNEDTDSSRSPRCPTAAAAAAASLNAACTISWLLQQLWLQTSRSQSPHYQHAHTNACKSLMHICLFTVSSMSSFSECSDLSPGGSVVVRCKLVNPEVESVLRDWLILYPPVKWHVFYPCCFTHSEKQMFCAADAGGAMICLIFRGVTTIDSDLIMVRGASTANMDFAGILSMFVSCFFWTLFMIQVCSAWECLKS